MLEKYFNLKEQGTSVRTEVIAGVTTFLTMSYIIFVNPEILSSTGMDRNAVFVATCLAAALGSLIMALVAKWPIGMAPGMGLNAFFAFTVVGAMGFTWQQALGAVFISGVIFLILTISGIRRWLIDGIPHSMRSAVAAGIGLFLGIIALKSSGIVVGNDATLVALGDVTKTGPLLAILGFFIIAALDGLKVRGAILIGILVITALSIALGVTQFGGVVSMPPSIAPTFLQLDIIGALHSGLVHVILVFVLVEVFDATGTLIGVAKRAGLIEEGKPNRLGRALLADSSAIVAGSLLGTSSTTAYVESASGVQAGGRTGLTALVVAALFVAALFFSPLAGSVPVYATAPALLYVACLMLRELVDVEWTDVTEAAPAALTALMMPFTYSIANGLAFGFISYAVLKTLTGRPGEVHAATWLVAALFVIRFAFFAGEGSQKQKGSPPRPLGNSCEIDRLFRDRVFAELAQVLRIGGRVQIRIFGELELHVVFADPAAVGDGHADAFAGAQHVLAQNVLFPLVDADRRRVEPRHDGVRAILQREDQIVSLCRSDRNKSCGREHSGKLQKAHSIHTPNPKSGRLAYMLTSDE